MTRTADHDARRAQITSGVRTLALTSGLGAVTVAGTAKAAGVSVGLVQHYYDSKEALLADTLRTLLDEIDSRITTAIARAERRHARIEHMLGAGLLELLPLDTSHRDEAYLRHAFAGLALDNPTLAEHQRAFDRRLGDRIAHAVRNGMECGEVAPETDALLESDAAFALTQGLAVRLLIDPSRAAQRRAETAVAARMASVFAGPCAREV
ncbi:TetR family transcriptional regulator [Nocardioides albertanoniae]|uniref:TetR family transcriptional regulator n=1 Tax=Nocardioides albertanoniae TaxID=1175486 RepID=A0A543A4W1_9ACTN|nr:TetR/AcrR family transcriptional regulator [Nocardioides albertanoniae]TQL67516.1 TetR family transcriptional regulator [Nocardioides albertanoniae]